MQDGKIIVELNSSKPQSSVGTIVVTDVAIVNDQLVIHGPNLAGVNQIKVKDNSSFDEDFTIESNTANEIVANGQRALAFLIDHSFELVISSANAAATYNVLFTLSNHSVALTKLDVTGATTGQFVKFDGTNWVPGDAPWVVSGSDVSRATGKVGIGTNIPSNTLSVSGKTDFKSVLTGSETGVLSDFSTTETIPNTQYAHFYRLLYTGSSNTGIRVVGQHTESKFSPPAGQFPNSTGGVTGTEVVANASGMTVNSIIGSDINTYTNSVATVDHYGLKLLIQPSSTSTTTTYGISNSVYQTTGTNATVVGSRNSLQIAGGGSPFMTNAKGVFSELLNTSGGGSIITGYGVYIGSVQATNKWALYSSDATAKSYFAGNVGIGISTPTYALEVNGTIAPNGDGATDLGAAGNKFRDIYATNAVINTSDERLKKNIENSNLGLNFIMGLRPVSYYWKQANDLYKHYGFIAQEMKESAGSKTSAIVVHDKKSDMYGLRYTELISPIVKAIQELVKNKDKQISEVNLKIAKLEQENYELNERLKKLENEMRTKN
jgi:hypothetical protein